MPSKDNSVASCAQQILTQVKTVVVGKDPVLLWVLAAILARGHILLEDIPGVGKTTMARNWFMMKPTVYRCRKSVSHAMISTATTALAIRVVLGVLISGRILYIRNATTAISR